MEHSFLGVFRSEDRAHCHGQVTSAWHGREFLCEMRPRYVYSDAGLSCFAWGNFYDLHKSCRETGAGKTDNPAEALALSFTQGDYGRADAFYGEFCFIHISGHRVAIGRDHIGAGPQVFYDDRFFASSLDAFKPIYKQGFLPDPMAVKAFLQDGLVPPPGSIIQGIKSLQPGEILVSDGKGLRHHKLLSFEEYEASFGSARISEQEAAEEMARLHRLAIRRRLAGAKAPAFLMSGGYDSGANLASFRELSDERAGGLSVGFQDDPWSELPFAESLARAFRVDMRTCLIDGREINRLPSIMRFLDNPFNENGLMVNYVATQALGQDNPSVILGGDGNDQLYGTGAQELALGFLASKYKMKPIQKLLGEGLALLGDRHALPTKLRFHNNRLMQAHSLASFGFSLRELKWLMPEHKSMPETDLLKMNDLSVRSFEEHFIANTYFKSFLHDGLHLIIHKASLMATLAGQRISFPYMDKDMIRFVWSLPREMRVSGGLMDLARGRGMNKYLHKKHYKPMLPPEITTRKKQGGFAPLPIFLQDKRQREIVLAIICRSDFVQNMVDKPRLSKQLTHYSRQSQDSTCWFWHRQNQAFKILNLLAMSLWWEIHIGNKKGENLEDFS